MPNDGESGHKARIVVVNDDEVQLRLQSGLLKRWGYQVKSFTGALETLNYLNGKEAPGLIVTDLHMPEIDGWRFCRLLRSPEFSSFRDTPVLVISATYSGEDAKSITEELGANAFLPVPIEAESFKKVVEELLEGGISRVPVRVLVVDDSRMMRNALRAAFSAYGYEVAVAEDGRRGLALLGRDRWDIVILDYHLPDMLGDALLEQGRPLHPMAAFVMITTDPDPMLAIHWMRHGASAYVRKPFEPEYLISLCEHARRERSMLHIEDLLEMRTQALQDSQALLDSALRGAALSVWEYDVCKDAVVSNHRVNSLLGYGPGELDEMGEQWWVLIHPEDLPVARAALDAHLRGETDTFEAEFRMKNKAGNWIWTLSRGRVVERDPAGRPVRVLGTQLNIDARKNTEMDLQRTREGLEERVEQRTEELRRLNSLLEQEIHERQRAEEEHRLLQDAKLESLNVMAGSIAHNFNNLLMAVLANLEMAEEHLGGDGQASMNISQAMRAAQRATELSTLMLTYVGKGEMRARTLDLSAMVREALDPPALSEEESAHVRIECEPASALMHGDPVQIREVITHLVRNGLESLLRNKGTVTIRTGVTQDENETRWTFVEVEDTGCGMTEATVAKAFDPFFTTKHMGRGLGLAAVHGIVRSHEGRITLTSVAGQGTLARAVFPSLPEGQMLPKPPLPTKSMRREFEGTVVVADDEPMVLDVARRMLERLGFNVLAGVNGLEALELFREAEKEVVCVVLDLTMPEMDGIAAHEALRALRPDLPIVLASGFTEEGVRPKVQDPGRTVFLQKPFLLDAFSDKLREVLREEK